MNKSRAGTVESQKAEEITAPTTSEPEKTPDSIVVDPIVLLEKRIAILEKAVEQMRLIEIPRINAIIKSEDKPVQLPEQKNHNPDRLPMGGEPRSYHQEQSRKG